MLRSLIFALAAFALAACGDSHFGTFTSGPDGFDTHAYWYDTGREVVVFDAGFTPDIARELIATVQAGTDSPITHVVLTHPNPDKFNGAETFRALGAQVVASRATAEAIPGVWAYKRAYFVDFAGLFTDETWPAEPTVDVTFDGRLTLELDGGTVELVELESAGVSSTQTVAWVAAHEALVVGDLVHHGAHAWLEGGIVDGAPRPDLDGWRAALEELRPWSGGTVYGGRGRPAEVAAAIDAQTAYLEGIEALVEDYVAELDDEGRASLLANDGAHWDALTARAAAAWPEHELAYMITYGVYGLAMQIASR